MTIHKEGYPTLLISAIIITIISYFAINGLDVTGCIISTVLIAVWLFLVSFFRNPKRTLGNLANNAINCPADGKIVVIEETEETEYLRDKRLLVSIFMSPLNVHVNRNPINGSVEYAKYHSGKYLAAWNPKSSTLNERTTTVYKADNGNIILMRQIAGALARRIVCYLKSGDQVTIGEDMGFIKLGSRVDLYLPLGTKLNVKLNEVVKGNKTIIGYFK